MLENKFRELVFEIAFGDNAINKGYTEIEVLDRLREFSDNALKWEEELRDFFAGRQVD